MTVTVTMTDGVTGSHRDAGPGTSDTVTVAANPRSSLRLRRCRSVCSQCFKALVPTVSSRGNDLNAAAAFEFAVTVMVACLTELSR